MSESPPARPKCRQPTIPPGGVFGRVCCPGTAGGGTPNLPPPPTTDDPPAGNNDPKQTLELATAFSEQRYRVSREEGGRGEEERGGGAGAAIQQHPVPIK